MLWKDTKPLAANRDHVLTLDCIADRITGYLDGAPLFEVYDNALPAGAIGLSPLAAFTEVRVTPADWMPYYRFPAQDRVPAGTRIRVPAPDLPDGALVRTLDVSGAPSGGRRVFGDNRYQAEQFRILRAADGTGFALLATPFPPAERRLRLTYRRDNTAIDPDSPVLRSAGDTSPETVTLDIPWPSR